MQVNANSNFLPGVHALRTIRLLLWHQLGMQSDIAAIIPNAVVIVIIR